MAKPDVQAKLGALGFTPALLSSGEAAPFIRAEVVKWAKLSQQAGIVPE